MFGWDPISTVVQLYITLTVHAVLLLFHLLVLLTIFITILLTPGTLCMTAPQRWDIIMYIFQIPAVVSFTFEQITNDVAIKAFHLVSGPLQGTACTSPISFSIYHV
jgi:hypothetical protein